MSNQKKITELTTKHELRNMVGNEIEINIKGKPVNVVITDVTGDSVTIMRKSDGYPATLQRDQFLNLVNK